MALRKSVLLCRAVTRGPAWFKYKQGLVVGQSLEYPRCIILRPEPIFAGVGGHYASRSTYIAIEQKRLHLILVRLGSGE